MSSDLLNSIVSCPVLHQKRTISSSKDNLLPSPLHAFSCVLRAQAVIAVLPKLVPAVAGCLEGSVSPDGASSTPPPPALAAGALGVLEAFLFLLRSSMRPYVKRVEDVTALWLQVCVCSATVVFFFRRFLRPWEHLREKLPSRQDTAAFTKPTHPRVVSSKHRRLT